MAWLLRIGSSTNAMLRIQVKGLHFGADCVPFPSLRAADTLREDWFRDNWFISKATLLCYIVTRGHWSSPYCDIFISLTFLLSLQSYPLPPQTSFYTQDLCSLLDETISFVFWSLPRFFSPPPFPTSTYQGTKNGHTELDLMSFP